MGHTTLLQTKRQIKIAAAITADHQRENLYSIFSLYRSIARSLLGFWNEEYVFILAYLVAYWLAALLESALAWGCDGVT